MVTRRAFLAGAIAAAGTAGARGTPAQARPTRLILLGTGGGPRPRTASSAAAQVIVSNGVAYVVDCGDGVARQLVFAGVPLGTLRHIFITHHHSDHNADYGNLILHAWTAGLSTRIDTWGPPPLENMTTLFFDMNRADISTRTSNERRTPLPPLSIRTSFAMAALDPQITDQMWIAAAQSTFRGTVILGKDLLEI